MSRTIFTPSAASPCNKRFARLPAFHPVPLRGRADGWLPWKQAAFVGYLAQTLSVAKAARLVGMSRESAYRLRARAGAQEFAAAWDQALGRGLADMAAVTRAARKVTPGLAWEHALAGRVRPVMRGGRLTSVTHKPDDIALLQRIGQLDRALATHDRAQYGKGG